jgi:hypothetical protein
VQPNEKSDPFLMTGYDKKRVLLSHASHEPIRLKLEADITGTGVWVLYREFVVPPGKTIEHVFPKGFGAYWVRVTADKETKATAEFHYE